MKTMLLMYIQTWAVMCLKYVPNSPFQVPVFLYSFTTNSGGFESFLTLSGALVVAVYNKKEYLYISTSECRLQDDLWVIGVVNYCHVVRVLNTYQVFILSTDINWSVIALNVMINWWLMTVYVAGFNISLSVPICAALCWHCPHSVKAFAWSQPNQHIHWWQARRDGWNETATFNRG